MADGIVINVNKLDILTSFFKTSSELLKKTAKIIEKTQILPHILTWIKSFNDEENSSIEFSRFSMTLKTAAGG